MEFGVSAYSRGLENHQHVCEVYLGYLIPLNSTRNRTMILLVVDASTLCVYKVLVMAYVSHCLHS